MVMTETSKDIRTYVASGIFIILVIMLMLFLTFVQIPTGNKDLVVTIISMLVGGSGVAMGKLFGESDADSELKQLKAEFNELKIKHATLQEEHDKLTALLVARHVINGTGFVAVKTTG